MTPACLPSLSDIAPTLRDCVRPEGLSEIRSAWPARDLSETCTLPPAWGLSETCSYRLAPARRPLRRRCICLQSACPAPLAPPPLLAESFPPTSRRPAPTIGGTP